MEWQIWFAGILFLIIYTVIISEKIHRTIIALWGAALLIILGILTQQEAINYIDFNTIGLLFGMMVIVGITRKSGIFEYVAIKAAHSTGGDPVKIMITLSIVTAVASAFLDNVTTVLLVVPVTISICSVLEVNPIPVFVAEIFSSNIGGTATLIGDPPNIMIGSAAGLGFMDFIKNLTPVIIVIFIVTILLLKLIFKKDLQSSKKNMTKLMAMNPDDAIKDQVLLKKSLLVIAVVIIGFVTHQYLGLESATIAITGATLLMLINRQDPQEALLTVEWATLFFFVGLFILVGGLEKVGIIEGMARETIKITRGDVTLSSIFILWFSAIASAFIDNIPFVATFIPLIKEMGQIGHMNIMPLWWALSLGACLGGNGTIIGASANVIVSGIAAQEGYPMTFIYYMKIAFPLMLVSILISMVYLLIFFV
ncbi:SLC13 family permease [Syntrophomonas wolfei]|uniref:SLC13 family permease n=1 Tax=Syntrophomonas wolfei TaxID=863 RepID=UPI00077316E9|nr:ArsB/NhaD family transporter [Syntrophomonas wolfei]